MKNNLVLIVAMWVMLCSSLYVMSSSSSSTAVQRNSYIHELLKEGKNETELHEAVRSGSVERVYSLCRQVKCKNKIDKLNDNGSSATFQVVGSSSSYGGNATTYIKVPGLAPIHLAVLLKSPAIVEILLSSGGDANCYGGLPNLKAVVTPLYFMLVDQFFDPQVLQILLDRGAYFFLPFLSVGSVWKTHDYSVFDILTKCHPMNSMKEKEQIPASDPLFDCLPFLRLLTQNPLSQNKVQILVEAVIDATREPHLPKYEILRWAPEYVMKICAKKSYELFAPWTGSVKSAYKRIRFFLKGRRKNSLFQNAEINVHIEALVSSDTMSDDFALIVLDFLTNEHGDPKDIFGSADQKVIQTLLLSTSSQEMVASFLVKGLKSIFEMFIRQHEKNEKKVKSWWRSANYKKILTADRISFFDPTTVNERYRALIKEGIEQRCSELNSSLARTASSVDTLDYDMDDAFSSDDST